MTTRLGKETSKTMSSGKDSSEDETSVKRKWDGSSDGLEEFEKKVGRWCRRKYGTEVGNFLWENDVPDFVNMDAAGFKVYCEIIWESINDRSSVTAKSLREIGTQVSRQKHGMSNGFANSMIEFMTMSKRS